jgi:glycosyltransferase involved in cell wall biosynthesis/SAM-dependent methyltransferase/spore maturation protein CgeB
LNSETLPDFRDRHRGDTILVCGCGCSLRNLKNAQRFTSIGVNDVGRLFDPTYLVVLNPRRQFTGDRFRYVESSRARAIFTQLDLALPHLPVVRFRLGDRGGADPAKYTDRLHYTRNSPYVALQLAIYMGASRIGLLGVDFTDDHFFARTGRHSLAGSLSEIDAEYRAVAEVARIRGIEIVNLSSCSRLTAFAKVDMSEWLPSEPPARPPRLFFVDYQFLSCGDVFHTGLRAAAREIGAEVEGADWSDKALLRKVQTFSPDLLFVVHGRKFAQTWGAKFAEWRSAVWLVDEPYEVDDTERTSRFFDFVFVNDPSTIKRHRNAHYLPVAFDPGLHHPGQAPRDMDVGFVGGANPARERLLQRFAAAGKLSYVVGGPWASPDLRRVCLSGNVPPSQTVELYQRTRIVLNVFRDKHHFNRRGVPAWSLNPRVYEALACGAMVVSEDRPEAADAFPEMPVFRSPEEALEIAQDLLDSPQRLQELTATCRSRLERHTYAARLRTVIRKVLGTEPEKEFGMPQSTTHHACPAVRTVAPRRTYAIFMVVCGGVDMVQLSTLRTLRHSSGQNARLVVVDNASADGTERWLRMLAHRGDIDLIRLEKNIGHGPALEKARAASDSEFIVTLDSDAFPVTDDWLERLRCRLDEHTLVAGIGHHRGYVHPSCLMIERRTLDRLGSTFLNEKGRPSKYDVAERLSHDVLQRGGKLALLERTTSQCRGSVSEPVYLGSEYESIVFHQWYTTRHRIANSAQVDDVPRQTFDHALQETLSKFNSEPRELTVVVGLRVRPDQPERERNAAVTLESLNNQDLERWRYRIVVVEQDNEPRLQHRLRALADQWILAPNTGPYNRAWGFNVGATNPVRAAGAICIADADLLVARDFLTEGLRKLADGSKAVLPYTEFRFLTPPATNQILRDHATSAPDAIGSRRYDGHPFLNSCGGAMFIDASTYFESHGFNESFEGWGAEDREIWQRLTSKYPTSRLDRVLIHLHHSRPEENGADARRNRNLLERLRNSELPNNGKVAIGQLDKYAARQGADAWRYWEAWPDSKIRRVVDQELRSKDSTRRLDADLVARFGHRVLDVGCGPGAVYARLLADKASVSWTGVDLTPKMLRTAKQLFPVVPLARADAAHLPFTDGAFDAVLLRHVLEHLSPERMVQTLGEVMRVSSQILVVDFYIRPGQGKRETRQITGTYTETRWPAEDLERVVAQQQGRVLRRRACAGDSEIWVIAPHLSDVDASVVDAILKPPKVSIVMPTYRRQHVLPRTLEAVQKQTYTNWELILVDNAGDLQLSLQDPRIYLFHHPEKASSSFARNRGVEHATGALICFFDDDDIMFPAYLETFVKAFEEHPKASMVRCGMVARGGRENYSFATPECCVRKEFVTGDWDDRGPCQDQRYFKRLVARHRWSEQRGDIVIVRQTLCRALEEKTGGLRSGGY